MWVGGWVGDDGLLDVNSIALDTTPHQLNGRSSEGAASGRQDGWPEAAVPAAARVVPLRNAIQANQRDKLNDICRVLANVQ